VRPDPASELLQTAVVILGHSAVGTRRTVEQEIAAPCAMLCQQIQRPAYGLVALVPGIAPASVVPDKAAFGKIIKASSALFCVDFVITTPYRLYSQF
jgi:hypothetical protein